MNYKIVPQFPNAVFEPHTSTNSNSPYLYWHTTISSASKRNVHRNLELVYFTKGSARVYLGNDMFPATEGDVAVINSYCPHHWTVVSPIENVCLIIDESFCKYHNIDLCSLHFTEIIRDSNLQALFERFMSLLDTQSKFKDAEIKLVLLELLIFLCKHYSSEQPAVDAQQDTALNRISSAIAYIKENLASKLTVDDICNAVGLSRYYFMREFKRITGYTLTAYINIIRCEQAKTLLKTSQLQIKEISAQCGFENISYFTNVFKKHTGMSPSEFRANSGSSK